MHLRVNADCLNERTNEQTTLSTDASNMHSKKSLNTLHLRLGVNRRPRAPHLTEGRESVTAVQHTALRVSGICRANSFPVRTAYLKHRTGTPTQTR